MILDTNALSALFKKERGLGDLLKKADQLYIPVIVIGEYLFGLTASSKAKELKDMLEDLLTGTRILPVTARTAGCYADIRGKLKKAGTPIPENDIWIAALVKEHGQPLLSRDLHFDSVEGINRLEW